MASFKLVKTEFGIIVENVKIDKTIFVEKYTSKRMVTLDGGMSP
jgi:hypothetical protein